MRRSLSIFRTLRLHKWKIDAEDKGGKYFKAIGLILLAVILFHVDLGEVWLQLRLSDPVLIAAAIILIVPQVAVRAFRWQKCLPGR